MADPATSKSAGPNLDAPPHGPTPDAVWCTHCHTRDIGSNPMAGWGNHHTTEHYDLALTPVERVALDTALSWMTRDREPPINVAIVCVNALARITSR